MPEVKLTVSDPKYALKARDVFTARVDYVEIVAISPDGETNLRKRKNNNTLRLVETLKKSGYKITEEPKFTFNGVKKVGDYKVKIKPLKRSYDAGMEIYITIDDDSYRMRMDAVTEVTNYANSFNIPVNIFCMSPPNICQDMQKNK